METESMGGNMYRRNLYGGESMEERRPCTQFSGMANGGSSMGFARWVPCWIEGIFREVILHLDYIQGTVGKSDWFGCINTWGIVYNLDRTDKVDNSSR